ncbi:uncharacterized protein LOC127803841 isoform X2 [Diospyros lotus]|uniref:uncharacterized protein LOC127803841 isoform X2 n=1 Tax=Diospyros lotus TaxID=55363 RepID=UPI002259897C|nr:uncharacterized protein LOC127803841 isoform X2 [Diospyros lotus]
MITRSARQTFKFPVKAAKSSLYLITAAGAATIASQNLGPPLFPISLSDDSTPLTSSSFSDSVRAGLGGIARSSRAIWTIASSVVDYKYSLHGLSQDSEEYRRVLSEVNLRSAKRILQLCEANKGFYVKAGQFVTALQRIPKEYSATLSSLQDQVFLSFDEHPIAAASIAQVHRAVLRDHQEVAVKVQYPGLKQQLKVDVATMSFLSKSVAWFFPEYRFGWLVSEFAEAIALELDFCREARNAEKTAKNFKSNMVIRIPYVFWELTTSQVLTMEFCKGSKVDDLEHMREMGINPIKVAKAVMEVFAEMIFVHGFLHGDPHPGNILVSPEGPHGFCLVLLDHGIYKELDQGFRQDYCELWKAMILLDSNKILQLGENFGVGKYSRYFPLIFTGRTIGSKSNLGRGMSAEEKQNLKQELKSLKMEDISSFMESLPPDFLTILRTDGLLRSLLSKLGASQRVRLLAYAKYALYGLSHNSNPESDNKVMMVVSRSRVSLSYFRLRFFLEVLDVLSLTEQVIRSFVKRFKQALLSAGYLVGNLLPVPTYR